MNQETHGVVAFVQGRAERGGFVVYQPAAEPQWFYRCTVETSASSKVASLMVQSPIPATWRGQPIVKGEDLSKIDFPFPPEPD